MINSISFISGEKGFILNLGFWLCLCLQQFYKDFLSLHKERMCNPVTDTFSRHGPTICPAEMFHFRKPHKIFGSHRANFSKSAWAHSTRGFWYFPKLLGLKVNDSTARGSSQSSFVRGCAVGQPRTDVCHRLDHSWCCQTPFPGTKKYSKP